MEIEFNTSRVPKPGYGEPVARQATSQTAPPPAALDSAANLSDKLAHLPTVRPDKVAEAQALVTDLKYPPDDVLDRVAVLLAANMPVKR